MRAQIAALALGEILLLAALAFPFWQVASGVAGAQLIAWALLRHGGETK